MSERLITISLVYGGRLTVPEPEWCRGHSDQVHPGHPVDFGHVSDDQALTVTVAGKSYVILGASLTQAPYATGDPLPYGGCDLGGEGFVRMNPDEIRVLADGLVEHAQVLREFADRAHEVREAARDAMRPSEFPATLRWPAPLHREEDQ